MKPNGVERHRGVDEMRGLFITGTDTEIGKTVITSLLALGLQRHGIDCCPIKPVASGCVEFDGGVVSEDALAYAKLADITEPLASLSPVCLRRAASPHFAAMLEGRTIDPEEIIQSLQDVQQRVSYLLVEGVGGWLVPITESYLVADLAGDLDLPIVVVVANRLGAINHALLTLEAIRMYDEEPLGVIINHPTKSDDKNDDLLENNIRTIERIGPAEILGVVPYLDSNVLQEGHQDELWNRIENCIQWDMIIDRLNSQ